ncbi:hypothetical protein [Acinetobacter seifertii]|uniref:hypothetical protein n=1 Tax=Acinetobacter seifertii TaxID=1530123 RepID=UPI0006673165|nr:hypothetical protein [Acinetobacter seifertii]
MQWILVKTFSFPYEAQIAKTQLEAFGIPARIEVDDAKAFLEKDFSEDLEQEFGKNKEQCPNCGSYDIEAYTQGKKSAFVAFMFFGLPLFSFKNGNRCKQCQYFWS